MSVLERRLGLLSAIGISIAVANSALEKAEGRTAKENKINNKPVKTPLC